MNKVNCYCSKKVEKGDTQRWIHCDFSATQSNPPDQYAQRFGRSSVHASVEHTQPLPFSLLSLLRLPSFCEQQRLSRSVLPFPRRGLGTCKQTGRSIDIIYYNDKEQAITLGCGTWHPTFNKKMMHIARQGQRTILFLSSPKLSR